MTRRRLNVPAVDAERVDLPLTWTVRGAKHDDVFTVHSDPGMGSVMAWHAAADDHARDELLLYILSPLIVDDDGLPLAYTAPDDGSGDTADPRLDDQAQWSSARRWRTVLADPLVQMPITQVRAAVTQLIEEATGERPTAPPARSTRGRQATRRASTASPSSAA